MADEPTLIEPFATVVAASGLPIPPDRVAGINGLAADLYAMAARLREMGIAPIDEPSNIYHAEAAR